MMNPAARRHLGTAMPWLIVIVVLLLWEASCTAFHMPEFILPRPSRIIEALIADFGAIWFHAQHTLITTLTGFILAVLFGLVLGILIGSSRLAYQGLYPLLVGFNSVPKVALVPVMVVWFGIGTAPAVLTAFMLSFFPVAVNVATGLATLEPELEDVLRSLGATRRDIVIKVGLPRAMPYFFASLKVAITLAFVGSVIAETLASNEGIGTLVEQASANFRVPLVFAGLFVVSAMGILMYVGFALIERRITGWAIRPVDFGIGG
jgi:NitT/TauT family transport system permease protein